MDQVDFAYLQACITGPGECTPPGCECFDRPASGLTAGDGHVDNDDLDAFDACATGPGINADPVCDNAP